MPLDLSSFFRNSRRYQVTTPDTLKRNFYRKSPLYSTSSYTSGRRSPSICETPGPGSYCLPSPDVYKKRAPSFSMRDRSFLTNRNDTPGPGSYSPEKVWIDKKSAPRYTFGIRHSPFVVPTHRLERTYL